MLAPHWRLSAWRSLTRRHSQVKALVLASGLEEEADEQADLRNAFAASWHQDLEHWKATWFTSVGELQRSFIPPFCCLH